MDFLDGWWMIVLALVVVSFVLAQSAFFLLKALKQAKALGIEASQVKRTIVSTMVFSVAPSVAILLGLLALSKVLGVIIPWIRLSVLGAVTYELPATINVVEGVFSQSVGMRIASPDIFVTVVWVMTLGVLPPMVLIPLFLKRIQGRVKRMRERDNRWGEMFMNAMFLGMISAFLGYVVAPRTDEVTGESYVSVLAILTLVTSMVIMLVIGVLVTKFKMEWLKNYAISFAMLGAMGIAILYAMLGVR